MMKAIKKKEIPFIMMLPIFLSLILIFVNGAFASNKIPKVRLSVKPLDLSSPPTTEQIMAAGQLGGQLYPTTEIRDKEREQAINLSFGEAIQEWNKHEYKKAIKMFRKHIEDYPDSPWASEAVLHIGCDAQYNGRYTEAEESFNWILEKNKGNNHEGARVLLNKATLRLAVLKVYQNNFETAGELFSNLRAMSSDWRDRTYASHWIQRLSRYTANELAMLNCGTLALAHLMERDGKTAEARKVMEILPETTQGHNLKSLAEIAAQYGYKLAAVKLSTSELKDLPMPAIMQISGKNAGDKGHYWVLEEAKNDGLELYDPQSRHRFSQNLNEFSKEWNGNALVFADRTVVSDAHIISSNSANSFEVIPTCSESFLLSLKDAGQAGMTAKNNPSGLLSVIPDSVRNPGPLSSAVCEDSFNSVIPAQAGIQVFTENWIPDYYPRLQTSRAGLGNDDPVSIIWSMTFPGASIITESKPLPGVKLSDSETEEIFGGCCGVPRPEDDLGCPGENAGPDGNCCNSGEGAPIWKVNMVNMNLFVTDIPMWYNPPIGPPVKIQISYNSQSAIAQHEPFGNKWQFNYGSYLTVDTGGNVTIFMPDGRRDVYSPDGTGGYIKSFQVFNTLTKIAENHFELKLLDGTVYIYNIPAGTGSLQPFLIEIRDAFNQKLTFNYDSDVRLTSITDAMNRTTTLVYTGDLVTQVNDPFGRSAFFEYDAYGNLTKITDMGGYWTSLSYDADVYLTSIGNDRGTWRFFVERSDNSGANSDNYPPPGDLMWQNYRITITNPLGGKEEYFYYGGSGTYSWYISPRDYIEWQSQSVNNFRVNTPRTYHYLSRSYPKGKISKIQYPEGGYTAYQYDTTTGKPTMITDYHGHITHFTYNSNGLVTSFADARGKTTTTNYYSNNIDVDTIVNGLGTIKFIYNGNTHDVASITDRLNNVTVYGHNSYGQLTSATEAQGTAVERTTELVYDTDTHNLTDIKRGGNTLTNFMHDPVGRVKTVTDAAGLTLAYAYNNLNQITNILYPDTVYDGNTPISKFVDIQHSSCCPRMIDSITDRAGRTTYYFYDPLKRLTDTVNLEGGVISNEYDDNGNLISLIDEDRKATRFEYYLDNRLKKKIYADGKFVKYDYDKMGLLTKVTNSRNIEKNYTYDPNHNLLTISYSDTTPGVTFTYDDYNRMDTRTDGIGLYDYDYDANNRLKTINGPWADDTVSYDYNELKNLKNLKILKDDATVAYENNYVYDYDLSDPNILKVGRLSQIQAGAGNFGYGYTGVNPLIQSLTRPNGSVTEYFYNDPLKRLTDVINKNSAQQIINSYSYTYNNLDVRGSETIINGDPITTFQNEQTIYNYNNVNQLLSTTNPNRIYIYDDDGNMTQGYTPEGYALTMAYDAENRLKTAEYTDSGGAVHRIEYSYSGDLLLAEVKKYENGNLISDTRYIRAGFLPVQERDASNNLMREYTWGLDYGDGIGGLLNNLKQGGLDYSYLYDGKGNVSALIDASQNAVATYTYGPFGELMAKTGSLNQPYMFSTKGYDPEMGLSYYGYRFYNPSTGKWITRDPIGEAGGINLYGFVKNNPVNLVDPLGLYGIGDLLCDLVGLAPGGFCFKKDDFKDFDFDGDGIIDAFDDDDDNDGVPDKDDCAPKNKLFPEFYNYYNKDCQ